MVEAENEGLKCRAQAESALVVRSTVGWVMAGLGLLSIVAGFAALKLGRLGVLMAYRGAAVAAVVLPQVLGLAFRAGVKAVAVKRGKQGEAITQRRNELIAALKHGVQAPFGKLKPLLERYDPGSLKQTVNAATLKAARDAPRVANERQQLLVLLNAMLDTPMCDDCQQSVRRSLGPHRTILQHFTREIAAASALNSGPLESAAMALARGGVSSGPQSSGAESGTAESSRRKSVGAQSTGASSSSADSEVAAAAGGAAQGSVRRRTSRAAPSDSDGSHSAAEDTPSNTEKDGKSD